MYYFWHKKYNTLGELYSGIIFLTIFKLMKNLKYFQNISNVSLVTNYKPDRTDI